MNFEGRRGLELAERLDVLAVAAHPDDELYMGERWDMLHVI